MLQIIKTINLNSTITLKNGETETVVAHLNASIGDNKLSYNINANIVNETIINANEENKAAFAEKKQVFENEVKTYLTI